MIIHREDALHLNFDWHKTTGEEERPNTLVQLQSSAEHSSAQISRLRPPIQSSCAYLKLFSQRQMEAGELFLIFGHGATEDHGEAL
jgi:hypothetical protein